MYEKKSLKSVKITIPGKKVLEAAMIMIVQQKTGKIAVKPIPDAALSIVQKYIESLSAADVRLFRGNGVRTAWDRMRRAAGLFELA